MNQLAAQRVNQKKPTRSPHNDDPNIVEDQPLDRGDILGLDRGQVGSDLDPRVAGIRPAQSEDERAIGDGERVRVERAEQAGAVDEPALLAGAEFAQLVARHAAQLGRVAPLRHCCFRWSFVVFRGIRRTKHTHTNRSEYW